MELILSCDVAVIALLAFQAFGYVRERVESLLFSDPLPDASPDSTLADVERSDSKESYFPSA
jgi:hypothetical protein